MSGDGIQLRYIRRSSDIAHVNTVTDRKLADQGDGFYENTAFSVDDGDSLPMSNWTLQKANKNGDVETGATTEDTNELYDDVSLSDKPYRRKRKQDADDGDDDDDDEDSDSEAEDLDDDKDGGDNWFLIHVKAAQEAMNNFMSNHGDKIKYGFIGLLIAVYSAYFAYALYYSFEGEDDIRLLWITLLAGFLCFVTLIRDNFGGTIYRVALEPPKNFVEERWTVFKW